MFVAAALFAPEPHKCTHKFAFILAYTFYMRLNLILMAISIAITMQIYYKKRISGTLFDMVTFSIFKNKAKYIWAMKIA